MPVRALVFVRMAWLLVLLVAPGCGDVELTLGSCALQPREGPPCAECRETYEGVEDGELIEFDLLFALTASAECGRERFRRAVVVDDDAGAFGIVDTPAHDAPFSARSGDIYVEDWRIRVRFVAPSVGLHGATIRIETTGGYYEQHATVEVVPRLDSPGICYDGPPATHGVGACQWGRRLSSTECVGEVLPLPEDPDTQLDEDCSGSRHAGRLPGAQIGRLSLAFDGVRHAMVWRTDFQTARLVFIEPDGEIGRAATVLSPALGDPAVAFGGTDILGIVFGYGTGGAYGWVEEEPVRLASIQLDGPSHSLILGPRATSAFGLKTAPGWFFGALASGTPIIEGGSFGMHLITPADAILAGFDDLDADWNGSSYGIIYDDARDPAQVRFQRIDREGRTLATSVVLHHGLDVPMGDTARPRIAWTGSSWIVAASANGPGEWLEVDDAGIVTRTREAPPCGALEPETAACPGCARRQLIGLGDGRFVVSCTTAYVVGEPDGSYRMVPVAGSIEALAAGPDGTVAMALLRADPSGFQTIAFALGDTAGLVGTPIDIIQ